MSVIQTFGALLLIHAVYGLPGSGTICLSCNKVVQPRDCNIVTRCEIHEKCGITKYISTSALEWYSVGCMPIEKCSAVHAMGRRRQLSSSNIQLCLECCNGSDLCNQHGCSAQGFATNTLFCYDCPQHLSNKCDTISVCGQDQMCGTFGHYFGGDFLLESRCAFQHECKTSSNDHFVSCCNSTLCNNASVLPPTTTTTTTTTTTSSTTHVPSTTTLATTTMKHAPVCASGWHVDKISGSRYCFYQTQMTWDAGKHFCARFSTHLPIIETREQLEYIALITGSRNIWLDGTDEARENYWVWSTTGQPIKTFFWPTDHTQPDNYYGNHSENCLELEGDWNNVYNDAPCDRHLFVVCEDGINNNNSTYKPDCPLGGSWIQHGSFEYCAVNNLPNMSWYEAKQFCSSLKAHLPHMTTFTELEYIKNNVMHSRGEIWLDGTEEGSHGTYRWSATGAKIYPWQSFWQWGQPDDYKGDPEECIEFGQVYNWKWNDAPCGDKLRENKVICERHV